MLNQKVVLISAAQSEIKTALEALPSFVSQLPDVLKPLVRLAPPKGLRAQVSLRHGDLKKSRQVKSTAPADSWSPESDIVLISYDESEMGSVNESVTTPEPPSPAPVVPAAQSQADDPGRELLLALAKAESAAQFVSLKWFRDTFLPQQGFPWGITADERYRVLTDVINRRWVLTSRVPNPKNPQFPVTTIRANRPLAEVREILDRQMDSRSSFAPIMISGEPLSQTILRERR